MTAYEVIYCNTKEVSTQNVTSLSTNPGKHYSLVLHTYQSANQTCLLSFLYAKYVVGNF